jgi:hypothetical protein
MTNGKEFIRTHMDVLEAMDFFAALVHAASGMPSKHRWPIIITREIIREKATS